MPRVVENRRLKGIFGKRGNKLPTEELHDLYSSPRRMCVEF
jgi:hypothetical protein